MARVRAFTRAQGGPATGKGDGENVGVIRSRSPVVCRSVLQGDSSPNASADFAKVHPCFWHFGAPVPHAGRMGRRKRWPLAGNRAGKGGPSRSEGGRRCAVDEGRCGGRGRRGGGTGAARGVRRTRRKGWRAARMRARGADAPRAKLGAVNAAKRTCHGEGAEVGLPRSPRCGGPRGGKMLRANTSPIAPFPTPGRLSPILPPRKGLFGRNMTKEETNRAKASGSEKREEGRRTESVVVELDGEELGVLARLAKAEGTTPEESLRVLLRRWAWRRHGRRAWRRLAGASRAARSAEGGAA